MGPQLYRCGNDVFEAKIDPLATSFNGAATLSLRKQCNSTRNNGFTILLQWGRNFIVAETVEASIKYTREWSLQWGRNFIVAETHLLLDNRDDGEM